MDTLKGKKIMVWTFMGNTRMYNALRDYGDRISQIGLFSFKVRATGEIYESGVSISSRQLSITNKKALYFIWFVPFLSVDFHRKFSANTSWCQSCTNVHQFCWHSVIL